MSDKRTGLLAAERALHCFELASEAAGFGIYEYDIDNEKVRWSGYMRRLLGISEDSEACMDSVLPCIHPEDRERVHRAAKAVVRTVGRYHNEFRILRPGGETRWILDRGQSLGPVNPATGKVALSIGTLIDVTEQRQAEIDRALWESRFRSIYKYSLAGIAITGADGRFLECNPAYSKLVGYSESELREKHFSELFHPDECDEHVELSRAMQAGEISFVDVEGRYVHKSGRPVWTRKIISLLPDEAGAGPHRAMVLATNITKRKQAEDALRESERRERLRRQDLEAVLEAVPAAVIFGEDRACSRLSLNRMAQDILGLPHQFSIAGSPKVVRVSKDGRPVEEGQSPLHRAAETGQALFGEDMEIHYPDGRSRFIHGNALPLFDEKAEVRGAVGAFFDCTEWKNTEKALRESEATLARDAAALHRLNEASSRLWRARDLASGLDEVLGAAIELLGADRGGIHIYDAERGVIRVAAVRGFDKAIVSAFEETRIDDYPVLAEAMRKGETLAVRDVLNDPRFVDPQYPQVAEALGFRAAQYSPLVSRDGTVLGMLSTQFSQPHALSEQDFQRLALFVRQATDFLERCRADEVRRESEERLRAIVDTAVDAIIVIDEKGEIQSINPSGARIFGYSQEELVGKNIALLMPEQDATLHNDYILKYLKTGQAKIMGSGRELLHRRKDGTVFNADLAIAEWRVAGQRYFTGTIRDITERKRHEEEVQLLLREVNHRSKNMLALVQAIARQTVSTNPEDFLERFEERVRALAAAQDLLVKSEWKGVVLTELIRSQLAHFRDAIGERISLDGPPLFISAPAAQTLAMALHELATNAGKYGALSSSAGTIHVSWSVGWNASEEADSFELEWREANGPAVNIRAREGFGSTVLGPMTEMSLDAQVQFDFEPTGVIWRLNCPLKNLVEGKSSPASVPTKLPPASPQSGRGCVLVVEDEALVALEIGHALREARFEVLGPARCVAQALELLKVSRCGAAVLDINLGSETSETVALELNRRGIPFVIVSGYSLDQLPPAFEGVPALVKPLHPDVLKTELLRLMAENSSGPIP
ncbi:PAS domain S-box protein [Rhodomicrobium sp. Az07]|uniref:PAS domain S-box protein n=1 Tax=Rhodomicrobium sp. Az07 TaxID=2839034 RepID=UPI001BE85DA2|nr:PAS domain S-box protein [Rhodomicrobium sp. Az07]MBT3069647.1 PAS domain S-box protein [Rhodomicrobium sp. Az07]